MLHDFPISSKLEYQISQSKHMSQDKFVSQSSSTCIQSTGSDRIKFDQKLWIWLSCLRSNEPCAVKAGPLPPNVNTAQVDQKLQKKKLSTGTDAH
jgi:hypothetical protein